MKFEITQKGVNIDGKRVEPGTVVEIEGDKLPGYLVGKGREVKATKTAVTNPAKGAVKQDEKKAD